MQFIASINVFPLIISNIKVQWKKIFADIPSKNFWKLLYPGLDTVLQLQILLEILDNYWCYRLKNGPVFPLFLYGPLKVHPHLYANAKKACGTEVNRNECQKVACSAFATQANEQAFRWLFVGSPNACTSTLIWLRTYFSLKYWFQMNSVRLFAEHTPHKQMKANAVQLHDHIMRFTCVFAFISHSRTHADAA